MKNFALLIALGVIILVACTFRPRHEGIGGIVWDSYADGLDGYGMRRQQKGNVGPSKSIWDIMTDGEGGTWVLH